MSRRVPPNRNGPFAACALSQRAISAPLGLKCRKLGSRVLFLGQLNGAVRAPSSDLKADDSLAAQAATAEVVQYLRGVS
jgi:hypothetical protein